ncbi:sulfotransferase family 2 domain-containing protein [Microbulbifer sp. CNSA002]|uniref:sulfotransferase family 2 domain-containing protein n=1 Tax=unclassified Microbulbifer TaxID=2619833 RepID=UPI0039B42B6C
MKALVSTKGRFAYVPIPKNACTSIKEFIFELDNGERFEPYESEGKKIWIHDYFLTKKQKLEDLGPDFFSFAVVRDPVERFISAYNNRVGQHNELSSDMLGDAASDLPRSPGLGQFIDDFTRYFHRSNSISHHFGVQAGHIPNPGKLTKIYFISELKSLSSDLSDLVGASVTLKREQVGGKRITIRDLSRSQLKVLIDFYERDYHLLKRHKGYTIEDTYKKWMG